MVDPRLRRNRRLYRMIREGKTGFTEDEPKTGDSYTEEEKKEEGE